MSLAAAGSSLAASSWTVALPGPFDYAAGRGDFAGVAKFPARVKCALLPWMAFKDAAARAGVDVGASPEVKA